MADNITVDNATLTDYAVATDERVIGGGTAHVQRTSDMGAGTVATGGTAVGTAVTTIAAARDTRKRIVLVNYQTLPVYIGSSGVTATSGIRLDPGASLTLATVAEICGITGSSYTASGYDDKVHFADEYDA